MKKTVAILLLVMCASIACAQGPQDVPKDHWAYDAVSDLMSKGYVVGFPDGTFQGNRSLTRYEFATIITRILEGMNECIAAASKPGEPAEKPQASGIPSVSKEDLAKVQKLIEEFKPELVVIGTRIDKVEAELAELKASFESVNAIVTDPEGAFETMKSDVSKLKKAAVSGYVQTRYQTIDPTNEATSEEAYMDSFIVRRARIKVTANPTDNSQAVLQLELAKNAVSVKDAIFVYNTSTMPNAPAFAVGQMNWPFGYEIPLSSSVREVPERCLVARRLFPGERDQGAKLYGSVGNLFDWQLGVYNGTGTEKGSYQDKNDRKDIVTSLKKRFSCMDLGVSYYGGQGVWQTFNSVFLPYVQKSRYGADLQYYFSNFTLKAEYFKGRGVDEAKPAWNQSDFCEGYYAQLAANINPSNQLVARWSTINTDPVNPQFGRVNEWDLGFVRWLDANSRIKLFYIINNEEKSSIDNNGFVAEWIVKY